MCDNDNKCFTNKTSILCKICNEEKGSMDFEEFKKLKQKELQETAKKAMFERQTIGRCLRVPSNVKILEIENKDYLKAYKYYVHQGYDQYGFNRNKKNVNGKYLESFEIIKY